MHEKPDLREILAVEVPLHDFLGIEVGESCDGRAEVRISVTPRLLNANGAVHGGIFYTLCDVAASYAFYMVVPRGHYFVTNDMNISLVAPAFTGVLTARAEVLKVGKRMGFVECKIYDQDDSLLATGRISKSILAK